MNADIIHRYYDPNTGRYLTPDPLGVESDPSLYSFAAGNPLRFVDAFGLRAYDKMETVAIVRSAIVTLKPRVFPYDMLTFAYRIQKAAMWDFKNQFPEDGCPNTYDVPGFKTLEANEFGNYFAGYVSGYMWGGIGVFLSRIGGHMFATGEGALSGDWAFGDDEGSVVMIDQGELDADRDSGQWPFASVYPF